MNVGFLTGFLVSSVLSLSAQATEIEKLNFKPTVIFDVGSVLFKVDIKLIIAETWKVGLLYFLRHFKLPTKHTFEDCLKILLGEDLDAEGSLRSSEPLICRTWLSGKITAEDFIKIVAEATQQSTELSGAQKAFVLSLISKGPELMAKVHTPDPDALKLVKELKDLGVCVKVLSNFDKESFDLLREKYKEVFDSFDEVIVSAEVGYIKPDKEIYEITALHSHPSCIYLFDDKLENIKGAKRCGWKAIHHKGDWLESKEKLYDYLNSAKNWAAG